MSWSRIGGARETSRRWNASRDPMDKDDIPLVDVVRLKALSAHRLWLLFSTGEEAEVDLSSLIAGSGVVVEPLKDPAYFGRVFIEMGVPTWPNGFDLDAINLYLECKAAGALRQAAAAQ